MIIAQAGAFLRNGAVMRYWLIIAALASTAMAVSPESPVYFPDPNLKAAVEATLRKKDPNSTDMLTLRGLSIKRRHISGLEGLQYAVNIKKLLISDCNLEDLSPLSVLTSMRKLTISNSRIKDISPLSQMKDLNRLYLSNNLITDISALGGLDELYFV
jgi:hypothetical protein